MPNPETEPLSPGPDPTPSQARCSVCEQTFGGITGFDAHRVGPVSERRCLDPRDVRIAGEPLHQDARGVWRRAYDAHPASAVAPQSDENQVS